MNDSADAPEQFTDFGALFADARRLKAERRRGLHEALTGGPPEPAVGESARDRLEQLLDAETLATVDEHVAELLAEREPADAPDVITAAIAGKSEAKRALADTLRGRRPRPPEPEARVASFDGGAREPMPRPPPSHGEQLVQVIRSRAADRGSF